MDRQLKERFIAVAVLVAFPLLILLFVGLVMMGKL